MALYAQTSGTQSTNSATYVPIPGLSLTIPEGVGTSALVILNLPMPYAQGNNYPGATVGITVNGTALGVAASFTYNRTGTVEHRSRADHAGRQRAVSRCAADHRRGLVRCARQHRHHRQPSNA